HTPPPLISPLSLHDALPICPVCSDPVARLARGGSVHGAAGSGRPGALAGLALSGAGPSGAGGRSNRPLPAARRGGRGDWAPDPGDRKSTRLNSSHRTISYAV